MNATEQNILTLYHGTSPESAMALCQNGWNPNSWFEGGNCGRRGLLYLTSNSENARWFSNAIGCNVVLEVTVPLADLIVDPEDGIGKSVAEELSLTSGLPGSVALHRELPASCFRVIP